MNSNNRVIYLDNLRGLVILLVVIFHASLTCMEQSPVWWYIHNESVSPVFSILVVIADTFMMPALFLVSGLVQGNNFKKANVSRQVRKRAQRLLLPWILGVILVGPYLSIKMANNFGEELSWYQMITEHFHGDWFTQGPYWYLSLLFTFFLISLAIPEKVLNLIRSIFKNRRTVYIFLFVCSVVGFWLGSKYRGADAWLDFAYFWSFQPSRILTYLVFFVTGLATSNLNTGYSISGWKWNIACILSAALLVVLKGRPNDTPELLMSFAYGLVTLTWTLRLFGFAQQKLDVKTRFMDWLATNSFLLYLIHLPVQIFVGSMILEYKLNSVIMWLVLIVSALLTTWIITILNSLVNRKALSGYKTAM